MEDLAIVIIGDEWAYGPFSSEDTDSEEGSELGQFLFDYEASFEFFPKPAPKVYKLTKMSGGDAALIHVPPLNK